MTKGERTNRLIKKDKKGDKLMKKIILFISSVTILVLAACSSEEHR